MLILTRKVDQGIVIQGNILVTVLRVEKDRVKLGISAPNEITVLRDELLERNGHNENSSAKSEQPEQEGASKGGDGPADSAANES
jgi:carbon storage regulator